MAKFYALANIDHDGKRFERGDVITIDGDAAERLLSFDVIQKEPVEKGIAAEVAADAPNKPALIEMIKAVPADANVGAEL